MKTRSTQSVGWWSGMLVATVLVGCNDFPTTGSDGLWEGPGSQAAAEVVEGSWHLLVSAEDLHLETLNAVSTGSRKLAAERLLFESSALSVEADYARRSGDETAARFFDRVAEKGVLSAAIAAFGPSLVSGAIEGVEATLSRVDGVTRDRANSTRVAGTVSRARSRVAEARSELSRGDSVAALALAVAAADELRELNPGQRARAAVAAAVALLARAIEIAGPDPRPELAEALRDAKDHCDLAERALDAGDWHRAVAEARECSEIARRVIAALSGGIPENGLEERAHEAVVTAAGLYDQAVAVAGPNPTPAVQRALDHAHDLLLTARTSLGNGDFREAIGYARESAALSKRIIGALSGGGRPNPDGVTILPYPYPLR